MNARELTFSFFPLLFSRVFPHIFNPFHERRRCTSFSIIQTVFRENSDVVLKLALNVVKSILVLLHAKMNYSVEYEHSRALEKL